MDYASCFFSSEKKQEVVYQNEGFVYGPLRVSANPASEEFRLVIAPTLRPGFLENRRAFIYVRDPRDVLVSAYFSFGKSHVLSANPEMRALQEKRRSLIQTLSLDEFCILEVDNIRMHFDTLQRLLREAEVADVLRFEDIIADFDLAANVLQRVFNLPESVRAEIYSASRPLDKIDNSSHRRSGKIGVFRNELQSATIDILNQKLASSLRAFDYPNY